MRGILFLLAFSISTILGPCEALLYSSNEVSGDEVTVEIVPVDRGNFQDVTDFIAALEAQGASVEQIDTISQPFFAVDAEVLVVNESAKIQVYAYADMDTAMQEAALVDANGSAIGTSMVSWMMPPHFYQSGNLIVIYLGTDTDMMILLEGILDSQFAGK